MRVGHCPGFLLLIWEYEGKRLRKRGFKRGMVSYQGDLSLEVLLTKFLYIAQLGERVGGGGSYPKQPRYGQAAPTSPEGVRW